MQERELDNHIKRQRLAIQAATVPYDHPVMKRLRIYIFATHAHQPAAAADQDASKQQLQPHQVLPRTSSSGAGQQHGGSSSSSLQEPPSWTLNLWGRLVDLNDPAPPADSAPAALLAAMQVGEAGRCVAQQLQYQAAKHLSSSVGLQSHFVTVHLQPC
jgi:hypothetical protein